jgi:hypothetical protein
MAADACSLMVSSIFVLSALVSYYALRTSGRELADIERWSLRCGRARWFAVRAAGVVVFIGAIQHTRALVRHGSQRYKAVRATSGVRAT